MSYSILNHNIINNNLTEIVYQHDSVDYSINKLKVKSPVRTGQLLLIEHGILDNFQQMRLNIFHDRTLFDLLYPRSSSNKIYNVNMNNFGNYLEIAHKKVQNNIFSPIHNNLAKCWLGKLLTRLNHSCDPSATIIWKNINNKWFGCLIAIRNLNANEEITILYRIDAGHMNDLSDLHHNLNQLSQDQVDLTLFNFDFECKCGLNKQERARKLILTHNFEQIIESRQHPYKVCLPFIELKLNNYIQTNIYNKICNNQSIVQNISYEISRKLPLS